MLQNCFESRRTNLPARIPASALTEQWYKLRYKKVAHARQVYNVVPGTQGCKDRFRKRYIYFFNPTCLHATAYSRLAVQCSAHHRFFHWER